MANYADDDDIGRSGVYADLLVREEEKHARLGGVRMLIGDKMLIHRRPSHVLAALRAGEPVGIMDWQLPRWARIGRVKNIHVCVHPDGRMADVD